MRAIDYEAHNEEGATRLVCLWGRQTDARADDSGHQSGRFLASGIADGGRFILREGNDLSPNPGLDKIWAMYDAVGERGRTLRTHRRRSEGPCF